MIMVSDKLINRLLQFAEGYAKVNDYDLATGKRNNPDEDGRGSWTSPEYILETVELVKYQMKEKQKNKLPSRFQNRDYVSLNFGDGIVPVAKIIKVSFTESKVLYDVEIPVGNNLYTRMYSVDSAFVEESKNDKEYTH